MPQRRVLFILVLFLVIVIIATTSFRFSNLLIFLINNTAKDSENLYKKTNSMVLPESKAELCTTRHFVAFQDPNIESFFLTKGGTVQTRISKDLCQWENPNLATNINAETGELVFIDSINCNSHYKTKCSKSISTTIQNVADRSISFKINSGEVILKFPTFFKINALIKKGDLITKGIELTETNYRDAQLEKWQRVVISTEGIYETSASADKKINLELMNSVGKIILETK